MSKTFFEAMRNTPLGTGSSPLLRLISRTRLKSRSQPSFSLIVSISRPRHDKAESFSSASVLPSVPSFHRDPHSLLENKSDRNGPIFGSFLADLSYDLQRSDLLH